MSHLICNMNWREQLFLLEQKKDWGNAIAFLQGVIKKEPQSIGAYLSMLYLLMNLLVEEKHGQDFEHDHYEKLVKKYFLESYEKFSDDPEYLFFTGLMAFMSEWYFDIELDRAKEMMEKALKLEPNNLVYQWAYYGSLELKSAEGRKKYFPYAQLVLQKDSPIKKGLLERGSMGRYLFGIMKYYSTNLLEGKYLLL